MKIAEADREAALDARAFKEALSHYASGITVIAGHDAIGPMGFTCQSFCSVSLSPPLVSFSVMENSTSYPRIRQTGKFCVNVLAASQQPLSDQFGRKSADRWTGVQWDMTENGNPIIAGTLAWIDCRIAAEYHTGDHYIIVGKVVLMSTRCWHHGEPLVYFKGKYRHLHTPDASRT